MIVTESFCWRLAIYVKFGVLTDRLCVFMITEPRVLISGIVADFLRPTISTSLLRRTWFSFRMFMFFVAVA